MRDKEGKPIVIASHGMVDYPERPGDTVWENMEIARQCQEAAEQVASDYPIAARILMQEAQLWRGA